MDRDLTHLYAGFGGQSATESRFVTDSLDLFAAVPMETDMTGSMVSVLDPVTAIQDRSPIKFSLQAIPNHYLDLNSAKLKGVFSVVRINKANLQEEPVFTDNVGICNYYGASLFSALDVNISGQSVSKMASPNLHLKMYLQTLLSYGSDAKATHLNASGWCMDDPGEFDSWTSHANRIRQKAVERSKDCEFVLPLNVDIFSINKLFPDFLNITFTFNRTRDEIPLNLVKARATKDFTEAQKNLMSETEKKEWEDWLAGDPERVKNANNSTYKIKLKQLNLIVPRIIIQPSLVAKHQQLLKSGKLMRYPITRTEIKELTQIPHQSKSLNVQLYSGRLPNNIIIGLISSDALTGNFTKNPYNFDNHNVCRLHLEVNQKVIPAGGYTPDFSKGRYAKEYYGLFENTGIHFSNNSNAITPRLFKSGCTLYAFDLSPDKCLNYHTHIEEFGLITLHIELAKKAEEALTPVCFASFDDVLCINAQGGCFYELASAC